MDRAVRGFGQIRVIVEADPLVGWPTTWANVVTIADECIEKVVLPRYKARHENEKETGAVPTQE